MITYTLILTLLSVATISQSQESDLPALPAPVLTKITILNPSSFSVEWAPVESDEKNPVAGFMVKLWENEKETTYHPEEVDGLGQVLIKELRPIVKPINIIPKTEPILLMVEANTTEARFEEVKQNEDYQIRVQAFNDYGEEGPYSNVLGLKINGSENNTLPI